MDVREYGELRRRARVVGYLEALSLAGDKPLDVELAENLVVEALERLTQEVKANEQILSDGKQRASELVQNQKSQ